MFKSWGLRAVWTWVLIWQYLKWALICLSDITRKVLLPGLSTTSTFLFETTLHGWRHDAMIESLTLTPFCLEKSSVRKKKHFKFSAVISVCFCLKSCKLCQNNDHTCLFHYINTCRVHREMFNTRPDGLVFKHLPWDLANVNAWKNMCDPCIYVTMTLRLVLQDATSFDYSLYAQVVVTQYTLT